MKGGFCYSGQLASMGGRALRVCAVASTLARPLWNCSPAHQSASSSTASTQPPLRSLGPAAFGPHCGRLRAGPGWENFLESGPGGLRLIPCRRGLFICVSVLLPRPDLCNGSFPIHAWSSTDFCTRVFVLQYPPWRFCAPKV